MSVAIFQKKCNWALSSPLEEHYHDYEWGVPVHDDRLFFGLLILEGAQAGLSWATILKKREAYREAFDNFEVSIIAGYDDAKLNKLLSNSGIVRNKLKLNSVITNARAFLGIQETFGSFDKYIWTFVDSRTLHNAQKNAVDIPVSSNLSELMSQDLKKRGFKFVGAVICYAFMQATGLTFLIALGCVALGIFLIGSKPPLRSLSPRLRFIGFFGHIRVINGTGA